MHASINFARFSFASFLLIIALTLSFGNIIGTSDRVLEGFLFPTRMGF